MEKLSVSKGQLLHFNLCALMYTEHEARNRKGKPRVKTKSCQWLAVDFKSQESNTDFMNRFDILQKVRNDQLYQWRMALRQAKNTPITRAQTNVNPYKTYQKRDSSSDGAPQLQPLSFSNCSLDAGYDSPPDRTT